MNIGNNEVNIVECILEWIKRQPTCPVDRRNISPQELKPVPRYTTHKSINQSLISHTINQSVRYSINQSKYAVTKHASPTKAADRLTFLPIF